MHRSSSFRNLPVTDFLGSDMLQKTGLLQLSDVSHSSGSVSPDEDDNEISEPDLLKQGDKVLPYRAGHEADGRKLIHQALSKGHLACVVSTSALQPGLDIGEIDIAVLLSSPPTVKSFHQRIGGTGRAHKTIQENNAG
jgi:ATP-dependent helicase YprA (DUF1998 family)